jgi:hypothetical protein
MPLAKQIWAIYPRRQASHSGPARNHLRREFKGRSWDFQERPTEQTNLTGGGRTREILAGPDATLLYRNAHRFNVTVIAFGPTHVFLHPDKNDAISHNLIARLQTFLDYKCTVKLVENPAAVTAAWAEQFADAFEASCLATDCENEHDPRCLPLHVFKHRSVHSLETPDGRKAFDVEHGAASFREDSAKRQWRLNPRAFHAQAVLHVARKELPSGFHWDVQPGGDSTLVVTTKEVWKVGRYVNVYPDSHIRGMAPYAKRVV